MTKRTISRNSKHVQATPVTAEQYLWGQLDKYTKSDHAEEFQEQNEHYNKTSPYNEQLYNSSNRNITQNKQ